LDLHGREVLIPLETDLRIIDRDGSKGLSTVSYSRCREYTGNATLRLDSPETSETTVSPRSATQAPPAQSVSPFPEGLKFHCRIVTPIDSDNAAAGAFPSLRSAEVPRTGAMVEGHQARRRSGESHAGQDAARDVLGL
jgi:hypothetical protein